MYYLNKFVWFWLNPATLAVAGSFAGLWLAAGAGARAWRRRAGILLVAASASLVWFASTLACVALLGLPLERPYLALQTPDSLPKADAIVLLGGGIGKVDGFAYPEMYDGADRVWHAARLYRAGNAPLVVVSGDNDLAAAVPLLLDLGVPREAIAVDNSSRNTYENSRFTERLLAESGGAEGKKVLLVTSAWHMPRACGNFSKTSLSVVPAATDFKATSSCRGCAHWWDWIAPSPENIGVSAMLFKEWLGRLAAR